MALALCLCFGAAGCDDSTPGTDAGGGGTDAGPGTVDSGPGAVDSGPGMVDSGPGMVDSGPGDTDAGPGDTDAGPGDSDAGPDMDGGGADAGPGDAGATDAGSDAGTPATPAVRYRDATTALRTELCTCDSTGFADAAECSAFGLSPEFNACDDMAYMTTMAMSMGPLDCFAAAREARAMCAATAACDATALETCGDDEQTAFLACADPPAAYGTELDMCAATTVIGSTASTCPENSTTSMALGDSVFTGTTVLGGADITQGCRDTFFCDAAAADRSFQWTAPTAGDFTFDTAGTPFDTILSVTDDCAGTTELECNDDASGTPDLGLRSRLTLTMTAGQNVIVHVAGCGAFDAGTFQVNINAVTP